MNSMKKAFFSPTPESSINKMPEDKQNNNLAREREQQDESLRREISEEESKSNLNQALKDFQLDKEQ